MMEWPVLTEESEQTSCPRPKLYINYEPRQEPISPFILISYPPSWLNMAIAAAAFIHLLVKLMMQPKYQQQNFNRIMPLLYKAQWILANLTMSGDPVSVNSSISSVKNTYPDWLNELTVILTPEDKSYRGKYYYPTDHRDLVYTGRGHEFILAFVSTKDKSYIYLGGG